MFPGDQVLLNVQSLALSGDGIAKHEGLVFFVDGALPGETVRAQVTKSEKNLVRARVLETLKASPSRTKPICDYFGTCGGCAFQHLDYPEQLKAKRKALEETFHYLGGFREICVEPVIPSPSPYFYRNTVALSVRHKDGEPLFGFIGKDNKTFIPIEKCPITEKNINDLLSAVKSQFKNTVPEQKRRRTSQVAIRQGMDGKIYTSFKSGEEVLNATVCGKKFQFSGSAFFQVNFSILESFVSMVKKFLEPNREIDLLDLYCGVGLFALCLSGSYRNVLGIEEGEQAISFARDNAGANGIMNARFISGRTEEALSRVHEFVEKPSHVIVDPPRIGMKKEAIEKLLEMSEIKKLVYVSCHPATLIRDLKLLSDKFKIEKIQPFDMFPQTAHLETIVLLNRI